MTLVVARKIHEKIVLASDTRLTHKYGDRPSNFGGIVKAIILSPQVVVAFATENDNLVGNAICDLLPRAHLISLESITETLLDVHRRWHGQTDFLVCSASPARIFQIKDGALLECDSAFIGDVAAYNYFLENLDPNSNATEERHKSITVNFQEPSESVEEATLITQMSQAMQETITSSNFPSVGGLPIIIICRGNAFRYACFGSSVTAQILSHQLVDRFPEFAAGDASKGHYSFVAAYASKSFISFPFFFFPEGEVGIFFRLKQDGMMRGSGFRALSIDEAASRVMQETGWEITSQLPRVEDLRRITASAAQNATSIIETVSIAKRPRITVQNVSIVALQVDDRNSHTEQILQWEIYRDSKNLHFSREGETIKLNKTDLFLQEVWRRDLVPDIGQRENRRILLYLDRKQGVSYQAITPTRTTALALLALAGEVISH